MAWYQIQLHLNPNIVKLSVHFICDDNIIAYSVCFYCIISSSTPIILSVNETILGLMAGVCKGVLIFQHVLFNVSNVAILSIFKMLPNALLQLIVNPDDHFSIYSQ